MSPVSLQRFLVTVRECELHDIIVEAVSGETAVRKAKRIFRCTGLGNTDAFQPVCGNVGSWRAEPLVREVRL